MSYHHQFREMMSHHLQLGEIKSHHHQLEVNESYMYFAYKRLVYLFVFFLIKQASKKKG